MKFMTTFKIENLEKNILREIQECHLLIYKSYKDGDIIMDYTDNDTNIGILVSGSAELICSEYNGKSYLLENFEHFDLFGAIISLTLESKLYQVIATTDCRVAYLDYNHFITPCTIDCNNHAKLLENLLILMSVRSKSLSLRMNLLCKSTIREKLLTYLEYNQLVFGTDSFTIPISLLKLAQYLCVDRRSLMREIRKLNEEKIIRSSGRKFHLLYLHNGE